MESFKREDSSTIPSLEGTEYSATSRSSNSGFSSSTLSHEFRPSLTSGLSEYVPPERSNSRKAQAAESQFTMSQLRFDKLDIFGREDEKKILKAIVKRTLIHKELDIHDPLKGTELILISGHSGVGKSTLAKYIARLTKRFKGLFVQGKFDIVGIKEASRNLSLELQAMSTEDRLRSSRMLTDMRSALKGEPYSAIKSACLKICGELLYLKNADRVRSSKIIQQLTESLGDELSLIADFIPEFHEVYADEDVQLSSYEFTPTNEAARVKLHVAFRKFVRIISSNFSPLVMLLDDLHRADQSSLELINFLLSDEESTGFVLVGTYRSNEVDELHPLTEVLNSANKLSEVTEDVLRVTELKLENFSQEEVQEVLKVVLNMDDSPEISKLASICHKRTLGNMFHLGFFIRTLKDNKLLQYSFGLGKWQWDENQIVASTVSTGNVVDLVSSRLLSLPEASQNRLCIAACLGSTFDLEAEEIVWKRMQESYFKKSDSDDWIYEAEESGILENLGDEKYRWSHDQVQEAALSFIPSRDLSRFQTHIGRALLSELPDSKREAYLYAIVDLLNVGQSSLSGTLRLELAELNCKAAQKASNHVAVESMYHYASVGMRNLPPNSWQKHYKLALDLHTLGAEAAALLCRKTSMEEYAGEVLKQKNAPITDKLRAYKTFINSLCRENSKPSLDKGLNYCFEALAELGCAFPRKKFGQVVNTLKMLLKLKKQVSSLSEKDIMENKKAIDPNDLLIMDVLSFSMDLVFIADPSILGMWILKFGQLNMKNGLSKYTQSAYAQMGIIFSAMDDWETAEKCGLISEKIVQKFGFRETKTHAIYQMFGWSLAFKRPYHKNLQSIIDGYEIGLAVGDMNSTIALLVFYNYMSFVAGSKLASVEADCRRYSRQLADLGNEQGLTNIVSLHQCSLNFLTNTEEPWVLSGERIPDRKAWTDAMDVEGQLVLVDYLENYLCAVFGRFDEACERILANDGRFQKASSGLFFNYHETFVRGLCLFGMARKSKAAKYKRAAKKVLSTINTWVKNGNPNVIHYEKFFEAELAALNGKLDNADLLYHKALGLASRSGFLADSAIINERHADFLLHIRDSPDDAHFKMEEAAKLYAEWGAHNKATLLRDEYKLQDKPSKVFVPEQSLAV